MSVKHCPRCKKQGAVIDSRHMDSYVRRRYRCNTKGCRHSWTSAEFLIAEGDNRGGHKVKHYFEQQDRAATVRVIDRLRAVLDSESASLSAGASNVEP